MVNPFISSHKPVWENAKLVELDEEKLEKAIEGIKKEDLPTPDWHFPFFPGDEDRGLFIDLLGLDMAICFATTDFETKQRWAVNYKNEPGKPWRGTMANAACLARALDEGKPILDSRFLQKIDLPEMFEIFRTELYPLPMLKERTQIFREIGEVLERKYDGHFYNLFEMAGWRAFDSGNGIVERLIRDFPSFYDASPYQTPSGKWTAVYFFKRAQLFPMVYHGRALSTSDWPRIKDIKDVGPICDYVFPGVFEACGILKYAPILKERIKKGEIIPRHSLAEIELRSFGERVVYELARQSGKSILQIDHKVWLFGRDMPSMIFLVPTTDY